jgi:hypothetical protein
MQLAAILVTLLLGYGDQTRGPGETCREDADCAESLQCSVRLCRYTTASRELGQVCVDDLDCEGNLYCNLDEVCDDGRGGIDSVVSSHFSR